MNRPEKRRSRFSAPILALLFISLPGLLADAVPAAERNGEVIVPPVGDGARVNLEAARKRYQEILEAIEKKFRKKKGEDAEREKASRLGRAIGELRPILCRAREISKDEKLRKELQDERDKLLEQLPALREKGGAFNVWPLGMLMQPLPKDGRVTTLQKTGFPPGETEDEAILRWITCERLSMKLRIQMPGEGDKGGGGK